MKQLKTIYAVATFMGCALFTGCNDDYLQKYPEDIMNIFPYAILFPSK